MPNITPITGELPVLHPIQKKIVTSFASTPAQTFNNMKSFPIDPRNFVHHVGKLLEKGVLAYNESTKKYEITELGKLLYMHFKDGLTVSSMAVHTFVGILALRDNKILTVKRSSMPYLGHVGIPIFATSLDKLVEETAKAGATELGLKAPISRKVIMETIYVNPDGVALTHSSMHVFSCYDTQSTIPPRVTEGALEWMSKDEVLKQPLGYTNTQLLLDVFDKGEPENLLYTTQIEETAGL